MIFVLIAMQENKFTFFFSSSHQTNQDILKNFIYFLTSGLKYVSHI